MSGVAYVPKSVETVSLDVTNRTGSDPSRTVEARFECRSGLGQFHLS